MSGNREIEIKLKVAGVHALIARLRALGAKRESRACESNTLFDTADCQLRRRHAILRIRREQDARGASRSKDGRANPRVEGLLTFKQRVEGRDNVNSKYKVREEIQYRIKNAPRFEKVLRGIGMRPWFRYEKYRTKYRIDDSGLTIDLDETPIGTFLELEGPKRSIDRVAKALGYSRRDYITDSYLALFRAECSRKGLKAVNMLFRREKSTD
jgi:adenylate cyclase, class 2